MKYTTNPHNSDAIESGDWDFLPEEADHGTDIRKDGELFVVACNAEVAEQVCNILNREEHENQTGICEQ